MRRKQEQIWRQTNPETHGFQKVYYNPQLLAEDEKELHREFVQSSESHDNIARFINWGSFIGFWPAAWATSSRVRGWGVFFASLGYVWGWRQVHALNDKGLQSSLNKFASPFLEKYS